MYQVDTGSDTLDNYTLNQFRESLDHFRAVVAITTELLCIVNGEVIASILLKRIS